MEWEGPNPVEWEGSHYADFIANPDLQNPESF